jgi:hypothetical protein
MGPSDQPYLYSAPAPYAPWDPYHGFNPKVVSQASLAPKPTMPKQEGPLINFNRHPDSYLVMPSGTTGFTPLHPNTKKRVGRARKTQMALRCLQLVGVIGLLLCVICLKGMTGNEGWILRLPVSSSVGTDGS